MRHVDFHIDEGIVLAIQQLSGDLVDLSKTGPATFDDPRSFALNIKSASISIDTLSLERLLNRHVFGYRGSPLKKLHVGVNGTEIVQTGVMHKGVDLPFRIQATMAVTADGKIRLHPTSVRVRGMGVERVMRLFGVHLKSLLKLEPGHGASIDGNDFLLDISQMLPPPEIRGRLTAIEVKDGRILQTFGSLGAAPARMFSSATSFPNYMYFRGGVLRFGKLTMNDTDLAIVGDARKTSFDFSLAAYNAQLVAGYSQSTPALGLIVHMPDYGSLHARGSKVRSAPK